MLDSGFAPTLLLGLWRGGAPVGIAVQELLAYRGIECDHIAIRTASYTGIDQQAREVRVYALGYLIDVLDPEDRLLVIDRGQILADGPKAVVMEALKKGQISVA